MVNFFEKRRYIFFFFFLTFLKAFLPTCFAQHQETPIKESDRNPSSVFKPSLQKEPEEKYTPYDKDLLRLSEILGALHYIKTLCYTKQTDRNINEWRTYMQSIIKAEKPDKERLALFYEAFNHSYRAFSQNYHSCTNMARHAEKYYKDEGKHITEKLLHHYGNIPDL